MKTVVLAGILAVAAAVVAAPQAAAKPRASEPVYDFAQAVRETAWVDIGLDGDGDGRSDRVAADIIRPKEPAARGEKVPVIMDASPYYSCCGRGNESELKTYDSAGRPVGFPLYYDNFFVPRGYAVVLVDLAGTNRSRGCTDIGGPSDVNSARKVVDWLNGRANGYTTATGPARTNATWSTGAVGMIGKSYDGTVANGVAATGVDGLKTIVPIGAISSWYDYYRSDGANLRQGSPAGLAQTVSRRNGGQNCGAANQKLTAGATSNGDYNAFWLDRDYVQSASKVKASVLASHGLGDLNVKTINFGQWWEALNVERKIWLTQAGHVDPFDYRRSAWVDTLHKWFDHYLLGVDNGIEKTPGASVEREPDVWVDQPAWPAGSAVTLRPASGSTPGVGTLGTTAGTGTMSFTDSSGQSSNTWAAKPTETSAGRVLFSTGALAKDLHVSGTAKVTVTATPSTSTARLSAILVDYGPATIRNYTGPKEGIKNELTQSCWGSSAPGNDACYLDTSTDAVSVGLNIISRGWADLANHGSLTQESPLTPGQPYTMTFRLASTDHVVPQGHQLALIIGGTDGSFISGPAQYPKITVDLGKTSLALPVAGSGPSAVPAALPVAPAQVAPVTGSGLERG